MSQTAALAVLEIVALLLTLLFLAVQFASRQIGSSRVPHEALSGAMSTVVNASFLLTMAGVFGMAVVTDASDDPATDLMMVFLITGLFMIGISIRNTASALHDEIESNDSTGRFNTRNDQTTIEEFNQ